jgi:cytochrome c oxidase subunit III
MGTRSVTIDRPSTGSGHGGTSPPVYHGGDGGRNYGGSPEYSNRLRRARLGLLVALAPITALFVSLGVAYVVRHSSSYVDLNTGKTIGAAAPVHLPVHLLMINTAVLLLSSVCIEFARRKSAFDAALAPIQFIPGVAVETRHGFPWIGATLLLSICFLTGQWMAWKDMMVHAVFQTATASISFFYLLTATHAIHLAGGMVALVYAQAVSLLKRPLEYRRIVVDVTAWYWHFMALLWVSLFCILYFVR